MVETAFGKLKQQIEHSTSLQRSAVALITGLGDQLKELAKHPSADEINALADELAAHARELADAIAAHETDD